MFFNYCSRLIRKRRIAKAASGWLISLALCFVCLQLISTLATADEVVSTVELSIKPNRCVALHEGQDCYQHIVIRWRSASIGQYCLLNELSEEELKCWSPSDTGIFRYDFRSNKSVSFILMSMPDGTVIATSEMLVAWVYKSRKRQRMNWRLF